VTKEVQDAILLSIDSPLDSWILDSGASFHTTAICEILENYAAGDFGKVYLADGSALDIVGMGDVRIRVHNDSVWKLQKFRHVPELKKNLISVGQLDDEDHSINFYGGKWKVIIGARILAQGDKTSILYMIINIRDTVVVVDASVNSKLWHLKLRHMSKKGMKVLLSKGKLPALKSVESDICEGCILGKLNCKEQRKKKTDDDSVNVVVTEELQDALLLSIYNLLDSWILDSGASFHTTTICEILENYVAGDFGKVYLADGSALDTVGMGDVRIRVHSDSVWKLQKFRHVPKLKKNLISLGQLDDEGHSIYFHGGKWKVIIGARILAQDNKTCTLYMTINIRDTTAFVDASVNSKLWHLKLGHMSEKGMKVLLSKGKLPALKSVESNICEGCILGKLNKVSFVKVGKASKPEKLDLVHTDLWGPSPVASLGGSRYYLTFIDDSSRKV
jgi:hypothetical protein